VAELLGLSPLIVLSASVGVVMLVVAFYRRHLLTAYLASLGLVLALVGLWLAFLVSPREITLLIILDGYSVFFTGLILTAGLAVVLLSYGYLEGRDVNKEEYYIFLLLVVLGATVVVAAAHFAAFFLGLEILSVALYALIAYWRGNPLGLEAGVKYLILASLSDSFLLFGIALIYAECGSMHFTAIASAANQMSRGIFLAGTGMLVIGIGFKLAVVPFHMWTPDVYQGAPAPVTALLATVSKGAVFALLLRYFAVLDFQSYSSIVVLFTVVALASMVVGNLLALLQNNVKRILAYSSIAHLGYLLVAFVAGGAIAVTAVSFYLVAYFVTTLGAFGVVTVLSPKDRDAELLDDYRDLGRRKPWLAGVFTVMLLSLAGIPLTAGFLGKYYVLAAGIGSTLWLLVGTLLVTSVIGLFYYLRIVVAMYGTAETVGLQSHQVGNGALGATFVLAVLTVLLVYLGVYPNVLIQIIEIMVANLT
jgi:NADH-quinone oxidoreductase subunit N